MAKEAAKDIGRAKMEVKNADEVGASTMEAKLALNSATAAFDLQDFSSAGEGAKRAINIARDAVDELYRKRAEDAITDIEDTMVSLEEGGVEMKATRALLSRAKGLMSEGKYQEAIETGKRAGVAVKDATFDHYKDEAKKLISGLMLSQATLFKYGMDISDIKARIKKARALMNEKEAEAAIEVAKEADTLVKAEMDRFMSERETINLGAVKEHYRNYAEKMGAKAEKRFMAKAKSTIAAATDSIKTKKYKMASELIEEADKEILDAVDKWKYDILMKKLKPLEKEIRASEKENVDVSKPKELLEQFYSITERFEVSEVFLVHMGDGIMMSHVGIEGAQTLDEDLIAGMLTAIQNFVQSAFSSDEGEMKLGTMEFGNKKIVIERGQYIYLAAVFKGAAIPLRNKLSIAVRQIEYNYGNQLSNWEGDVSSVSGAERFMDPLLVPSSGRLAEIENLDRYLGEIKTSLQSVLREKYYEESTQTIDNARSYVDEIRDLGADTAWAAREMQRAMVALEYDDFDRVKRLCGRAKKVADKSYLQYQKERAKEILVAERETIIELKKISAAVGPLEKILSQSEDLLKREKYKEIAALNERFTKQQEKVRYGALKEAALTKVDATVKFIRECADFGAEVTAASQALEEAKVEVEKGDFTKSEEVMDEARTLASEAKRQFIRQRTVESLAIAEGKLSDAETFDLKTSDVRAILKRGHTAIEKGEYEKAGNISQKALKIITERIEEFNKKKAEETVAEVAEFVKSTRSKEIRGESAVKLLKNSRESLDSGKYQEAIALANKARSAITEERDEYLRSRVTEMVLLIKARIREAKDLGIDVKRVEAYTRKAERLYRARKFEESYKVVVEGDKGLEDALKQFKSQQAAQAISDLKGKLAIAGKEGVDTTVFDKKLAVVMKNYESGEFDAVTQMSKNLIGEIDSQIHRTQMLEAGQAITDANLLITDLKNYGIDVTDLDEQFQKARSAFDYSDYSRAREITQEIISRGLEEKERYLKKAVEKGYNDLQSLIKEAKKLSIDMTGTSEMLRQIKLEIDTGSYEKALGYIEDSIDDIKSAINTYYMREANFQIDKVRDSMAKVEEIGVDVTRSDELIHDALELVGNGEYKQAYKKALEASRALEKAKKEFKESRSKQTLGYIQSRIEEAEKSGADTSELMEMLTNAQAVSQDDNASLSEYMSKTDKMVNKIRFEYLSKRINKVLSKANRMADDLEYMEKEHEDIRDAIEEVRFALKFQSFDQAKRLTKYTRKLAKERYKESISDFISRCRNVSSDVEGKYGIKMPQEIEKKLKKAEELHRKKDFFKAFKLAKESFVTIEAREIEAARDKASEWFAEMNNKADYLRQVSYNSSYAEDLLFRVKRALDEDDFDAVKKIGEKIDYLYREAEKTVRLRDIEGKVTEIERKTDMLKEGGMNTKSIDKLVEGVRSEIDERELPEAQASLSELGEQYKILSNQYFAQQATTELEDMAILLRDLKRLGVKVKKPRILYERAQREAEKKNFVAVIDILEKAREGALKAREKFYSGKVSHQIIELRKTITELEAKQIDVNPLKKELREAVRLNKENKYRDAFDRISSIIETVDTIKKKFKMYVDTTHSLQTDMMEAKRIGEVHTEGVEKTIKEAEQYVREAKFQDAMDSLARGRKELEKVKDEYLQKEAKDKIKSMQFLISDSENRGMEVVEAKYMLGQMDMAAEYKDYDFIDKMYTKIEDHIDNIRTDYLRENLEEEIMNMESTITELIEDGQGRNKKVVQMQEMLGESKKEMEQENYNKARSMMTKVKSVGGEVVDRYKKIKLNTYISTLDEQIKDLKDRNLSSYADEIEGKLKETLEAKNKDEIESALAMAKEAEETADKIGSKVRMADEIYSAAKNFIYDLKNLNVSSMEANALIERAKKNMEEGNLEEVISQCKEAEVKIKDEVHSHLRQKAFNALNTAKGLITDIKTGGAEVSPAEKLISESKAAFKRKEYDKVESLVNQAKELASKAKRDKIMGGLGERIRGLREKFKEYEGEGVPLAPLKNDMVKVELAYRYKDAEGAEEMLKKVEDDLEQAYIKHHSQEASHLIMQGESLAERAKELDLDTSIQSERLKESRGLIEEKEFAKAKEIAQKTVGELRATIDENLERKAENQIKSTKELIEELSQSGVDASASNQAITEAQRAFDNRNYEEAIENIERALEIAKKTQYDFLFEKISEKIEHTTGVMNELKAEGANVFEVESLMTMAQSSAGLGDFSQAEIYVDEAKDKLKKIEGEYRRQRASDAISFTQFLIVNVRNFGGDTTEAERMFNRSKYAFDEGEYVEAERYGKEAEEIAKEAKKAVQIERGKKSLEEVQNVINDIRSDGVDVGEAVDILRHAETALKYENFDRIDELCALAIEKSRDAKEKFRIKKAEETIQYAMDLVDQLNKEGVDTKECHGTLQRARDLFNRRKYEEAVEYAKTAILEGQEIYILFKKKKWLQLEFRRQYTLGLISQANKELEELEELVGHDVKIIRTHIQKATFAFEEENHELATDKIKLALRSIRSYRQQHLSKVAMTTITELQAMVEKLQEMGLLSKELEEEFKQAESAMNYRKYQEAIDLSTSLKNKIDEVRHKHVMHEVLETLFNAEQAIMDTKALGIELEAFEKRLKLAKKAFEAEDYKKAMEVAREVYIKTTGVLKEVAGANEILRSVEQEIYTSKEAGVDVRDMLPKVAQAKEAMAAMQFQKVKDISIALEKEVVSSKVSHFRERSNKRIEEIGEVIKRLEEVGAPVEGVEKAKTALSSAKELVKEDEFKEADTYIKDATRIIDDIRHVQLIDMTIKNISKIESFIVKGEEAGVDVGELKKAVEGARDLMSGENYENALVASRKALELYEEGGYEDIAESVDTLTEEGKEDTEALDTLVENAALELEVRNYDRALSYLDQALTMQPDNSDAMALKIEALYKTKQYQKAWDLIDSAIENIPNEPRPWLYKGRILEGDGEYDEALLCYDNAITKDPEMIEPIRRKALCLEKLDRNEEAIDTIDKIIAINPNNVEAWLEKCELFLRLGQRQEAEACAQEVLSIEPDNEDAKELLKLCRPKGEKDMATNMLTRLDEMISDLRDKTSNGELDDKITELLASFESPEVKETTEEEKARGEGGGSKE